MRRVLAVLVGTALLVGVGASPAVANDRDLYEQSLGAAPLQLRPKALLGYPWVGDGSGISAEAVVSRGELIIEDRPFDDTGADTSPLNGPPIQMGVDAATLSLSLIHI